MGRQVKTLEISIPDAEPVKVEVQQLPTRASIRIQMRLQKLVVPLIIPLLQEAGTLQGDNSQQLLSKMLGDPELRIRLSSAVQSALTELTEKDFDTLVDQLLYDKDTPVCLLLKKRTPLTPALLDVVFQGDLIAFWKLLFFTLEVNFLPFIKGLRDLFAGALATVPATSPTPTP